MADDCRRRMRHGHFRLPGWRRILVAMTTGQATQRRRQLSVTLSGDLEFTGFLLGLRRPSADR